MSRASLLIVIGILAMLAPFSGLPAMLRTWVAIGLGAAVVAIGVALRQGEQHRLVKAQPGPDYAEPEPARPEPLEPHETPPPRHVMSSF